MLFTIELDCPPGSLRPGDLIEGVLKGAAMKSVWPLTIVVREEVERSSVPTSVCTKEGLACGIRM